MATFTSEGPNPLNPSERATCTLAVPDEVMVGTVQAICVLGSYQVSIPNPKKTEEPPATIWNPDYDETVEGSLHDIVNPDYAAWEQIPATIPNTEGPGEFAMRKISEWLTEQRQQYLQRIAVNQAAAVAAEEAGQIAISSEVV